jgi:arylsulfatase A-like enzyme
VLVICDGLGRDWIRPDRTPTLHALAERGLWCGDHRAVFPSVTRTSAASIATGCHPGRHGLHGNRMALLEAGRLVVRDVGQPDFLMHMRRATGGTLRVATLAERVAGAGGFVAFSNVSPGAAYFLDPEHCGAVYHRAGSFAPGGIPITGRDALAVSHDLDGDRAMTDRFCDEVLGVRRPAVAVLWLANPDHTLHGAPLGSPAHLDALRRADGCVADVVATVARRLAAGEDILLLVGSDHGQETVGGSVGIEAWLADEGLGSLLDAGAIAVAGQGTAALLYATPAGRGPLLDVLDRLRRQPWADGVMAAEGLAELGHVADGGLVAAINMARREDANPYGVPGRRFVAAEPGKTDATGDGQHGGWGPDETRPFLVIDAAGAKAAPLDRPSSLVDIAPTLLAFLGLPTEGMDGRPLLATATDVTPR